MSFNYRQFQFFVFFCVFSLSIGCTWNASGSDSWPNISYGAGGTVSDVENFVTRFYQQCLSREPDTAGLNGWVNDLNNGLKAGDTLAEAFVFSSEFQNRNTSNSEFLTILYKAFFNREPDTSGYNYWVNDMSNGASRSEVLAGFTSAQEFINLCQDYGISPKAPSNNDNPVTEFVTRFYQQCLNREPDTAGLNGWVNDLNGGLKAGDTLAEAFVFSSEFQNRNTSNSEFLTILYKAFFNRDPDASGYNNWINSMSSGTSRSEVLAGFTSAQEFINLCSDYQIRPTNDSPDTDVSINGSYVGVDFNPSSGRDVASLYLITYNGDGTGEAQTIRDPVRGPSSTTFTYQVSSDGTYSATASGESAPFADGIVSADGNIIAAASTWDDAGLEVLIKKSSGMSNASLNGSYVGADFNPSSGRAAASLYLITYNGDGTGEAQTIRDPVRGPSSTTFTYQVSSDGTYSATASGESAPFADGIVSADGNIIAAASTWDDAGLEVLIKKSSGMSNASLNGSYVGADFNPSSGTDAASLYHITYHGDGTGKVQTIRDPVRGPISATFTYQVSSDGTYSATASGESVPFADGIVSGDGNIIAAASTWDDAGLEVLIKQKQ